MHRTPGVLAGVPLALLLLAPVARAAPPVVQVPVVLDVHGLNGSHFTSDLTVVNLGAVASDVEVTFVATLGPSAGPLVLATALARDRQLYIGDTILALRSLGATFPDDGSSIVGTLLVRLPTGDAVPFVGSRISTPNADTEVGGSFGTYALGTPVGSGLSGTASVYGLRETPSYRTNLAVVHAGGTGSLPMQLSIQVVDGETGIEAPEPITVPLQPGEWHQIDSILARFGITQGWAKVRQTSGSDRFLAYAVVNDGGAQGGGTSDGSWIEPNPSEGTLPVVLSSGTYKTELILARPASITAESASLTYVSSDSLTAAGVDGAAHIAIPRNGQVVIPDIIEFLREEQIGIPREGTQGGTLRVNGAVAFARIYSPNPDEAVGGTFGVAFRAVAPAARATTDAWIYGLRQDGEVRSNIAVASATLSGSPVSIHVDLLDQRGKVIKTLSRQLGPAQFYQWNAPFANAGIRIGAAHVTCTPPEGSTCDFIAYGVVNDGAAPGAGTSDGSFLPMVRVQ